MEITVLVHQERDGFWSEIEELPGCFASGGTLSELREALAESIGLYVDTEPFELPEQPLRVGRVALDLPLPRDVS